MVRLDWSLFFEKNKWSKLNGEMEQRTMKIFFAFRFEEKKTASHRANKQNTYKCTPTVEKPVVVNATLMLLPLPLLRVSCELLMQCCRWTVGLLVSIVFLRWMCLLRIFNHVCEICLRFQIDFQIGLKIERKKQRNKKWQWKNESVYALEYLCVPFWSVIS